MRLWVERLKETLVRGRVTENLCADKDALSHSLDILMEHEM